MDLLIFRSHRLIALAYEKGGQDMQKNIIVSPLLITGISLSCITHCRKGFSTAISSVNKVGISSSHNRQSRGSTKDSTDYYSYFFAFLRYRRHWIPFYTSIWCRPFPYIWWREDMARIRWEERGNIAFFFSVIKFHPSWAFSLRITQLFFLLIYPNN